MCAEATHNAELVHCQAHEPTAVEGASSGTQDDDAGRYLLANCEMVGYDHEPWEDGRCLWCRTRIDGTGVEKDHI